MTPEQIVNKVYQTCKNKPEMIPVVLEQIAKTFMSLSEAITKEVEKGTNKLATNLDKIDKKRKSK